MAGIRSTMILFAMLFALSTAAVQEVLDDILVRQACPDYCWLGADLPNIQSTIGRRCPGGFDSSVPCTRFRNGPNTKLGRGRTCGCNGSGSGGGTGSVAPVGPPTPAGAISCDQVVISGDEKVIRFTLNPGSATSVSMTYQLYTTPDTITVSSGNVQVFTTGRSSGGGTRTISVNGPLTIVVNAPDDTTAWDFTVSC